MGQICQKIDSPQYETISSKYSYIAPLKVRCRYHDKLENWMHTHDFCSPHLYDLLAKLDIYSNETLQALSRDQLNELMNDIKSWLYEQSLTELNREDLIYSSNKILIELDVIWKEARCNKPHVATRKIDRDILNGFIRHHESALYYNVPSTIHDVCFMYYHKPKFNSDCVKIIIKWKKKLYDIVTHIQKMEFANPHIMHYIWNKIDTKHAGKLDSRESLSKLIYMMIGVYTKTNQTNSVLVPFKELQSFLLTICDDVNDIRQYYGHITKDDFVTNMNGYLMQIALKYKMQNK